MNCHAFAKSHLYWIEKQAKLEIKFYAYDFLFICLLIALVVGHYFYFRCNTRAVAGCLGKSAVPLSSCLALFCPEEKQEFQQEKTVSLKDIMDDNWGNLEDLARMRSLLPEMSLNERAAPSGHKRLLELLTMGNQNRKYKMAPSTPEVANIMSSVLTSVVKLKRQSLLPSLSKRRWSQEVAECIKLECSHMGSLEEIVPCQENCRAKW